MSVKVHANSLLEIICTCFGLEYQGDENQEQTTFMALTPIDIRFPFFGVQ